MENNMEGEVTMLIPPMQSLSLRPTSSEKSAMKDTADDTSSREETEWEEQRKTMFPVKDESELLLRKVRSVLNKISSVNYIRLRNRWLNLIPSDEGQLTEIIRLVVMKATDEPIFMQMYAQLFGYAILNSPMDDAERLRKMLLLHIHRCLQRLATDLELAKFAHSVERETFARQKKIQLYRFTAELYLEDVCSSKFVMERVSDLVGQARRNPNEADVDEPLECLCVFLTFAGVKLEEVKGMWLNDILLKINLREAAHCPSISKRIQFMVQDLLEMQSNGWMPHNKWWTPSATRVESRGRYSSAP